MTLAVVLVMGFALDSRAKGPESATLTGPGIDKPIALIDTSKSFDSYRDDAPVRLIGLTGLWYGPASAAIPPPDEPGPAYTLTWVNIGSVIYQYIYLDADGGALIHTPQQSGLDGWGVEVIGWFEAPDELSATIDDVIAWSTTEEAATMQPVAAAPVDSPAAPSPSVAPTLMWVALASSLTIGGLVVRRARRPA